ncbi:MAG: DUF5343 domain-containing protein [Candidatus Latescibacterota bacterium]|jgi:hypothetical protein
MTESDFDEDDDLQQDLPDAAHDEGSDDEDEPGEDQAEEEEEDGEEDQGHADGPPPHGSTKTWYPYITKAQFDKFLARLENRVPDQIDRDYIRAIIRTPSMIYRFLRGIEAMKFIDREQRPTARLRRLVAAETRRQTIAEVLADLYGDLLQQWQDSASTMSDDDIVEFFRGKTGMGRDSANKMKMFFKYLLGEADFSGSVAPEAPAPEQVQTASPSASAPAPAPVHHRPDPQPSEQPQPRPPQPQQQHQQRGQGPSGDERRGGKEGRPEGRGEGKAEGRGEGREGRAEGRGDGRGEGGRPERGPDGRQGGGQQRNGSQQAQSQRQQQQQPPQQQPQQPEPLPPLGDRGQRTLNEAQKAFLQTMQSVVRINIDGDWDDDMIRSVFDRLERLFDRIRRG